MYLYRNIEERWCNYGYSGKEICIIYSGTVFAALCNQHAMCMRGVVMCGLSGSTVFFHIISRKQTLKTTVTEHQTCVLFSSINLASNIPHSKKK
jgi:hypothetical protein